MRALLTRKLVVLVLVLVGAVVALAASRSTWVRGTVVDVTGPAGSVATGSEVAPGLAALALVSVAGAVAMITGRGVARRIATTVTGLAGGFQGVLAQRVLADPEHALGAVAGARTGGTAALEATAQSTAWPWVALVAAALPVLGSVGALLAGDRWSALGADPEGDRAATEQRGPDAPAGSDWDRLSDGDDPTAADGDETTSGGR